MARSKINLCRAFGEAVRQRRLELEMTQEEVAHRAGLNRSYITDIERGSRNISITNVARLVHALETTVPEFFRAYGLEGLE